jgi:hypothetical protein
MLFRTVEGLSQVAYDEIFEKLKAKNLTLSPHDHPGWISCEIEDFLLGRVRALRSIVEAQILVHDEKYTGSFSIDAFADRVIQAIPCFAPNARAISVSAYSIRGMPSQREIQGAFSRRIVSSLGVECNLKHYDTALKISLLKRIALASIDLEIQPGNIPKIETHPTPLLPPIAYCMIRLTSPQHNEHLVDPMCGCGTIPIIAALEWANLDISGSDISSTYVACAKRNAEALGLSEKTKFSVCDISDLEDTGVKPDIVAVNPPYGIAVKAPTEISRIYNILFERFSKILLKGGRIAVVTPFPRLVERLASRWLLEVKSIWNIREGKLPRTIHIILKPLNHI